MAICVFLYHIFHEVSEKKKNESSVFYDVLLNLC